MFTIFKEEKVITTGILVFLGLSILVRLLLAGFYHTMYTRRNSVMALWIMLTCGPLLWVIVS